MVSTISFIALPLSLAFLLPLSGFGKKRDFSVLPVLLSLSLAGLLLYFGKRLWGPELGQTIVEGFVLNPPMGISFQFGYIELFFLTIIIGSALMLSFNIFVQKKDVYKGYQYPIIFTLFLTGAMGIVLTRDIFNLFIFWEILSIGAYIFTALEGEETSFEGGIKYLLTGALSSIFILVAVAGIYYSLGTLDMVEIGKGFGTLPIAYQSLIFLSLLIGFGIEAEIFPLNLWSPDVFQAAESRSSGLFSTIAVKAAVLALLRLFFVLGNGSYFPILMGASVITLVMAEFVAFWQTNIKRLLGYSSIGQVALALIAISLANEAGLTAGLFHLLNHSLLKVLLFSVAAFFIGVTGKESIGSFKGLARKFPVAGIFFTIGALAVAGFPPFSPFASKMSIFMALAQEGQIWVVMVILAATVVEVGYYFKIIQVLYSPIEDPVQKVSPSVVLSWILPGGLLVLLGIYPQIIIDLAQKAALLLQGAL